MTTTYKSVPFAEQNAIEAAMFSVELQQPPTPDIAKSIKDRLDAFSADLPGEQAPPNGQFIVSMGGGVPPVGEALRFASKRNGEHAWRVQLTNNVLQVLCAEYTSFDDVWPRAMAYLSAMLSAADETLLVGSISHQYIDRFNYPSNMPPQAYNAAELFKKDNPYLTPKAWLSGPQWHVYQGWFDNVTEESRVLNQLNLSTIEQHSTAPHLACIVDHRCMHQIAWSHPVQAKTLADASNNQLDSVMRELHEVHTGVLRQLLQDDKLNEIGMVI